MTKIIVPATSANMGPGFDCLGIALNMYNIVNVEEYDGPTLIDTGNVEFNNKNNLIYSSMSKCLETIGYTPKGIKLNCTAHIPVSRGLGSSAACIVAGIVGANSITGNKLSLNEMLQIASIIEGHPDNVAAALLGGMVVSYMDNNRVYYEKVAIKNNYKFCALIPDFTLSTAKSRAVLPTSIDFKDAVFNIGRACLMIAAMNSGNTNSLKIAFDDRLHQPYRGGLVDKYEEITSICKELGSIGVFLSGAGPTIMTLSEENNKEFEQKLSSFINANCQGWKLVVLEKDANGTTVDTL